MLNSKMLRKIKNQDNFASPVSLTYQGSEAYQTTLGGLCTIFVTLLSIAYFVYEIRFLVNGSEY